MKSNLKMRALSLAMFSFLMSFYPASPALADEIIALVSIKHPYYEEALKGVRSVCDCTVKPYYLEGNLIPEVVKEIRNLSPKLLLAVGAHGLMAAKQIKGIPIVYSSVTKAHEILSAEKNIIGVSMDVPVDKQLTRFLQIAPNVKRIGFIYDPKNNSAEAALAKATAKVVGVELVAREVDRISQVIDTIDEIRKKIDAFWVLPDMTSSFDGAVKYTLDVADKEMIPVLIFSAKYLFRGATASLNIDQFSLGRDAGLMLKEIMAGTKPQDVPPPGPRKLVFNINMITAHKLGLIKEKRIVTFLSFVK